MLAAHTRERETGGTLTHREDGRKESFRTKIRNKKGDVGNNKLAMRRRDFQFFVECRNPH